ncbi:C40 family peptidase [Achromobacter marplatensis]|uniref:C40 family peptidase n=3 Tax=Achromobacter marplatensis TaxID=470868 RepID=A0AA43AWR1_9BURK|nr:C40 family peptidase [Achromobacter marplatensis]MDH2049071.1 C40 family peptidase [Achromobacter marplatensis]
MHRHSILARFNSSTGQAYRGLRTLALMACVAGLAGCAGTGQKSTAHTSEIDPYEMEWVATADDPIGMLVTHKFKRDRQQNHTGTNSDNAMVSEALNYLGIRYRFGGSSPDTGFDCSGLVAYSAERSLGLKLPRNAAEIAQQGVSVAKNELKAGDLVFFNTMGRRYSHVGIYLGDDRFVHSPSAGGVVRVESMTMAYWTKRYNGARRLDNSLMASARAAN